MVPTLRLCVVFGAFTVGLASVITSNQKSDNFELLILHNNDMHARFEQTSQLSGVCSPEDREANKCYGGFPRVAHVVKEARKAAENGSGPPVLYLNAGDTYTGTAWFTIYKWKIAAECINALKPDAVSLGNHEFDEGISGLTPFIANLTTPVLAANLILDDVPELEMQTNLYKSVIFIIGNVSVGVIGYLTPDTAFLAAKNKVKYIDEVIAIKEEAANLKKRGVNILIALGHSGFTKDLEIAKEVEDIDLVIGGHTNTFLWNGEKPDDEEPQGPYPEIVEQRSGKKVPAVQAYAYTKYLGKLYLTFNSNGDLISYNGNPILLDNSIPEDPDMLEIINKYSAELSTKLEEVVGISLVNLDSRFCRVRECNTGNLIADAVIAQYASQYEGEDWTDASVAIIQGGGIRTSIAHSRTPINITVGDLLAVMPFGGLTVKVTIKGDVFLKMLEHSVGYYNLHRPKGNFLQFSGVRVTYDLSKKPGSRVLQVSVRCSECDVPEYIPLDKNKKYNILTSDFIANGGDEFSMLADLHSVPLTYNDLNCTINYILTYSPIRPELEQRITLINSATVNIVSSSVTILLAITQFLS